MTHRSNKGSASLNLSAGLSNVNVLRINMDKKFDILIDTAIEKFTMVGVEVTGVLVFDRNGLTLASKDAPTSPGPIARLAELAALLSGRRMTVCLEHQENQVLVHQTDKAVVAVYTKHAT